jgi:hypothetical protein
VQFPEETPSEYHDIVVAPFDNNLLYAFDGSHIHALDVTQSPPFLRSTGVNFGALFIGYDEDGLAQAIGSYPIGATAGAFRVFTPEGNENPDDDVPTDGVVIGKGGGFLALTTGAVLGGGDPIAGFRPNGGAVAQSQPDGVVVVGVIPTTHTWRIVRCLRVVGCTTRDVEATLGTPNGVALDGENVIVTAFASDDEHGAGIALIEPDNSVTARSRSAGDRISPPLVTAGGACTFFAMASFFTGDEVNRINTFIDRAVGFATAEEAAGSITALAVDADNHMWGSGKSGVLFDLGTPNASCDLALPQPQGVARSLNSVHGIAFSPTGPVVGTDFGEIQLLPLAQ